MKPIHEHDCKQCEFVLSTGENAGPHQCDWYVCTANKAIDGSVVCRRSSEPHDYSSFGILEIDQTDDDNEWFRTYRYVLTNYRRKHELLREQEAES